MRRRDFLINSSTALAGLVVANNSLYSQIISNGISSFGHKKIDRILGHV